ncbi:MAG: hypothetical protein B7Z33_12415 [Sphingomonadales bacterium 12-68-11]|nr:MAG: hypothetical protein B7Z33_12415 [Sphingomonadales bacterium 12-68-11]
MTARAWIAAALATATLAGCGRQVELTRQPGADPVPVAYGADEPATAENLMTPQPQIRPVRNEDLLRRSEPRPEDPFDVPPGADNGR